MDIKYKAIGDVMRNGKNEGDGDKDDDNISCEHSTSAPISQGGFVRM